MIGLYNWASVGPDEVTYLEHWLDVIESTSRSTTEPRFHSKPIKIGRGQ